MKPYAPTYFLVTVVYGCSLLKDVATDEPAQECHYRHRYCEIKIYLAVISLISKVGTPLARVGRMLVYMKKSPTTHQYIKGRIFQ